MDLGDEQPASTGDFSPPARQSCSFTDSNLGTAATAAPSTTVNNATESDYEQNADLTAAFANVGITAFGSDASKPYPNPATLTFTNGAALTSTQQVPAGSTFTDGSAQVVPRYPTNIYYNVSTQAQETDEFNYPLPGGAERDLQPGHHGLQHRAVDVRTDFDSIVGVNGPYLGMFQHMMGNDPRPDYFHQTNMMSQTTGPRTRREAASTTR